VVATHPCGLGRGVVSFFHFWLPQPALCRYIITVLRLPRTPLTKSAISGGVELHLGGVSVRWSFPTALCQFASHSSLANSHEMQRSPFFDTGCCAKGIFVLRMSSWVPVIVGGASEIQQDLQCPEIGASICKI